MSTSALLRIASVTLCVLTLPRLVWPGHRLLWQSTASLPRGLYWQRPLTQVRHGLLVVADLPPALHALAVARGYLGPGQPVIKPVAALPGDTVCQHGGGVFREAERLGTVAAADSAGRALPQWTGCDALTDNVFLFSTRTTSFDSRYFGSIPMQALRGEAVPVWTTRDE